MNLLKHTTLILAVAALALATAGSAAAKTEVARLHLEGEIGSEAAPGTPLAEQVAVIPETAEVIEPRCYAEQEGTLLSNGDPSDRLGFNWDAPWECGAGYAISGALPTAQLLPNDWGVFKASPKIVLSVPGPCVYTYAKLEAVFEGGPPGYTESWDGGGEGKLDKRASAKSCAKRQISGFSAVIWDLQTEDLLWMKRTGPRETEHREPPTEWNIGQNG